VGTHLFEGVTGFDTFGKMHVINGGQDVYVQRAGRTKMPQTYYLGSRSLFVTFTAWVVIVLAALGCAAGVLEQASLASFGPGLGMTLQAGPLAPLTGWLLNYLPWVNGAGLLLSVALLVTAGGLLLRMEWARRGFIGLMVLSIGVNLAGLWLQHELVQSLVHSTLSAAPLPALAQKVVGGFVAAARLGGVLATLVLCVVMAWVIQRLRSPMVRQEFAA
jgi:hypothetical protein